tara:strand:- start:159 stop:704 length:546 start_codon:yes stop_codon:yes gene_type:complete
MLKTIKISNINRLDESKKKFNENLMKYKIKFCVLTLINVGDKIGKCNNEYFIQEKGVLQKLRRWWKSETRNKSFHYLDKDFIQFFNFCTEVCNTISLSIVDHIQIKSELIELISSVMMGLYNLKKTYENEDDTDALKLKCKIDSIILTCIDVKKTLIPCDNYYKIPDDLKKHIKNTLSKEI